MDDKNIDYTDEDLIYVDPDSRTIVGKVEFTKEDKPKSKPYILNIPTEDRKNSTKKKRGNRKFYPWGTVKSMRKIYKLEGYSKEPEPNRTLDEVLPKALKNLFWKEEKEGVATNKQPKNSP